MRIVVTGGRDYADVRNVDKVLDSLHKAQVITGLAQGGSRGADTYAKRWAELHEIPVTTFQADWQGKGRRAGPLRNAKMLDEYEPDMLVAFPGNDGTWGCMRLAQARNIRIWIG